MAHRLVFLQRWRIDPSLRSDLLSASALGFIGDVVCQLWIEKRTAPKEIADLKWDHQDEQKFDARRLWALTLFSTAYIGGFLHFLYQFYSPAVFAISKYLPLAMRLPLSRHDTMAHCLACACVDNIHCGSIYIPAYFISVGLLQGDSLEKSKDNLMTEWRTTYLTCTGFWIPFMWANWRHCAPAQRVKAMATGNLFWNVIIDHLAHRASSE